MLQQESPQVVYQQKLEETLQRFKQIAPIEGNNWKQQSNKNGYQIHTMEDKETGLLLTRGQGFIPYEREEIITILEKVESRMDYDELCESGKTIFKAEKFQIFHQQFKSMFYVISGRDFIICSKTFDDEEIWYAIGTSIELPTHPPIKGVVRGEVKLAGWILEKKEGGTQCTFITFVDPKGSLPIKAINMVATVQGEVVEKIKKLLDKQKNKK